MYNSIDRTIISVNAIDRNNTEEIKKLQQFLKFQLNYKTRVFLPAKTVTEIITRSEKKFLPLPEIGERAIASYSWWGKMLLNVYFLELLKYFETDEGTLFISSRRKLKLAIVTFLKRYFLDAERQSSIF